MSIRLGSELWVETETATGTAEPGDGEDAEMPASRFSRCGGTMTGEHILTRPPRRSRVLLQ